MYSPLQIARIKRLARDEYSGADERTALVNSVETAEELHQVALWFNHDGFEIREVEELIDHPKCSPGTALMIYWGLNPDYVYRQLEKGKKLADDLAQRIPLLRTIETKINEMGFTGVPIAFSPSEMIGRPLRDDDVYRPGIRLVPNWMKVDSEGMQIERINIE